MLSAHADTRRHERAAGTPSVFEGLRVMLVAGVPGPTRALVRALEACSAHVTVVEPRGRGLERAREIDPQLLLVDPCAMAGAGSELARRLDDDPRLRWASVTRVAYQELLSIRALSQLAGTIALVIEPDGALERAARTCGKASVDLARIGPARALRAAESAKATVSLTARTHAAIAEVVLAGEIVVSASFWETGPATVRLDGLEALSAFLTMRRGRISVAPCLTLPIGNVLAPLGQALLEATATAQTVCQLGAKPQVDIEELEWDEDDLTTARWAAQPAAPPVVERRPSSIAPISVERAPERRGGVPSPVWVAAGALLVLGALGIAIGMQPTVPTHEPMQASAPRHVEPIVADAPAPSPPPKVEEPVASAGEQAIVATEPPPPAWLADLPASPRRAVRELVTRARTIEGESDEEAERIYAYAHELVPHAPRPMAGLAEIHLRRGDADGAAVWADRAVQVNPQRASYHVLLGDALAASGDVVGARAAWTEGARLAPHSANIRRRLER